MAVGSLKGVVFNYWQLRWLLLMENYDEEFFQFWLNLVVQIILQDVFIMFEDWFLHDARWKLDGGHLRIFKLICLSCYANLVNEKFLHHNSAGAFFFFIAMFGALNIFLSESVWSHLHCFFLFYLICRLK